MIELKTKRLVIRSYQSHDEEAVYGVINDPVIYATTLNIPYPYPREQVSTWIHFTLKNALYKRGYECGIFDGQNQYLGNIGLVNIDWLNNNAEISYFIGSHYQNQGFATEAVAAMIKYAFSEIGLERIQGRCMIENIASTRVMEKNGLCYEGTARHEVIKAGTYKDVAHYSILQQDFIHAK